MSDVSGLCREHGMLEVRSRLFSSFSEWKERYHHVGSNNKDAVDATFKAGGGACTSCRVDERSKNGLQHAYYSCLHLLTPNTNGWRLKNRDTYVEGLYENCGPWLNG